MERRLIVGFDGSSASAAAVRWAAEEAERRDALVVVISCCDLPFATQFWGSMPFVPDYDDEKLRRTLEAGVHAVVEITRRKHPHVKFEENVVIGAPRRVLTERSRDADLMVLGRTGVGDTARFLLGSVADGVARKSECPVVLVRDERFAPRGRIVAGVDGSEASSAALDWAILEAELRECELVVVHGWWYSFGGAPESRQATDLTHVGAALVLDAALEHVRDRRGCAVRAELIEGDPTIALIDQSETADLVVVGSRGRGSVASMLLGSVAQGVSARAHCPTVVVRAPHPEA